MKSVNRLVVLGAVFAASLAFAQEVSPQRIGGNVMSANLITKVAPVYPAEAKQSGIQGVVMFEVTIDKDGRVSNLKVVTGPPELIPSAMDAVKQWVYKPTYLNGEPVSVLTTVDINFSLSQ